MLVFPSVSSIQQLRLVSFKSILSHWQHPGSSTCPGAVFFAFSICWAKVPMTVQRGVIWKNSWKRARDLREPHGVTYPPAFQRLVITNKSFQLLRGQGKEKKEGKKLTLWCDDRDFYKSHCVSHCCWQSAKPELAKFPQVECVTGSLKIHPQVFNYLFCCTRLLKLRGSVRHEMVKGMWMLFCFFPSPSFSFLLWTSQQELKIWACFHLWIKPPQQKITH